MLKLPGVRLLRAKLYYNSGITLEVLAEKTTEDIRAMVRDYIERENGSYANIDISEFKRDFSLS